MIRLVEDIGAPVAVTVVDMVTQTTVPQWNSWANYAMTVLGYAGAYLNMGGDFVKNVGVASLPKSLSQIYATVMAPAAVSRSVGYRMSQTQVPGFGGVKLI
ncbi:MAG: hypothetical protein PHN44_00665 [Candidatus Marinimicrobia bacterium]|nr:hypothetical protein [Candidatus Neomarinimicrobiota bacterium]